MTKYFAFYDALCGETFAVWAADELGAWYRIYCLDPDWAETQVSLLGEVSFKEQEGMKQVF